MKYRRTLRLLTLLAFAAVLVVGAFLYPKACSGPQPAIQPPAEPKVVESGKPAVAPKVEERDTTTSHVITRQPAAPEVRHQVDSSRKRVIGVEVETHSSDSATVAVQTYDYNTDSVSTRVYAFSPDAEFRLKADMQGRVQIERSALKREAKKVKRRRRWKIASVCVLAVVTFGLGVVVAR